MNKYEYTSVYTVSLSYLHDATDGYPLQIKKLFARLEIIIGAGLAYKPKVVTCQLLTR